MFFRTSSGAYYNLAQFTRVFIEDHPDLGKYYIIGEVYTRQYPLGIYNSTEDAERALNCLLGGESVRELRDVNSKPTNELSFDIA